MLTEIISNDLQSLVKVISAIDFLNFAVVSQNERSCVIQIRQYSVIFEFCKLPISVCSSCIMED